MLRAKPFYSLCHEFPYQNNHTKCLDRSTYMRLSVGIRWEVFDSFQAQLAANRAHPLRPADRAVLWLQPARRETVAKNIGFCVIAHDRRGDGRASTRVVAA